MADFSLTAEIRAVYDSFQSGMQELASSVQNAGEQLQSGIGGGAEAASAQLQNFQNRAEETANSFNEQFSQVRETALHVVEALALVEGVRLFKEAITSSLEFGEHLTNLSLQTGISTDNLQKLQFAATATGTDIGRLTAMVGHLSTAIASGSSTAQRGLSILGLQPSDLNDTYGLLLKVSDAIQRLGPTSEAARVGLSTLFGGRMGLTLLPVLANLREFADEAERMGLILDSQTVASLTKAQEQFNVLGAVIDVDKERLAAAFTPLLETVASLFTQLAEKVNALAQTDALRQWALQVAERLIDMAETLVEAGQKIGDFFSGVARAVSVISGVLSAASGAVAGGLIGELTEGIPAGAAKTVTAADTAKAHLEDLRHTIEAQFSGLPATSITGPALGGAAGAAPLAMPETAQQIAQQARQAQQAQLEQVTVDQQVANSRIKLEQATDQTIFDQRMRALQLLATGTQANAVAELTAQKGVADQEYAFQVEEANKEYQAQLGFAQRKLEVLQSSNVATRAQIEAAQGAIQVLTNQHLTKLEELERQHGDKIAQIDEEIAKKQIEIAKKAAEEQAKAIQEGLKAQEGAIASAFEPFVHGIDQMVQGVLQGTQRISDLFKKMLADLATMLAESLIKDLLMGGGANTFGATIFGQAGAGGGLLGALRA